MENNTETTMNETTTDMKETEMNETNEMNEATAETKEAEMDAEDTKRCNFNLNDYGFKFSTKSGDYGFKFCKDDDSNWGLAFTSPDKADAQLVFEKGEGAISFTNADGEKKEMINFTAAREWFESFGAKFTMSAKDEENTAEATPVEAEVEVEAEAEAVQADAQ